MESVEALLPLARLAIDHLATGIELIGLAVVVLGVGRAGATFLRDLSNGGPNTATAFADIRIRLGLHILLGLEILICADIMHTVVRRSVEDLVVLCGVVAIRTVIAFFLHRELRDVTSPSHGATS